MAVTLEGSATVPADRAIVWANLNDPDVLLRCIPALDKLEKASDTRFLATVRFKLGPVGASLKGRFDLHDVDAPRGCRISAEGESRLTGFARGAADVRLAAVEGGTVVNYVVEANLGGAIAKFGGRLIDGVARSMADRFFAAFSAIVAPEVVPEPSAD